MNHDTQPVALWESAQIIHANCLFGIYLVIMA